MTLIDIAAIAVGVASIAVVLGFIVWAFIDVYREKKLDETSRLIWLLFIFLIPLVGAVTWLVLKPRGVLTLRDARARLDRL